MPDEFLQVARKEIQSELSSLDQIVLRCKNDTHLFKNSKEVKGHLHKIKGLAPMMGEADMAEIAKIADAIMGQIVCNGILKGSLLVIGDSVDGMKKILAGDACRILSDFKKTVSKNLPQGMAFDSS